MDVLNNSKIDAIYPLSATQQSLLFHHLSGIKDEGFIHIQCVIHTTLDRLKFVTAWNETIKRHEVLRSSVYWEGLEKPLRIVHSQKEVHLIFEDWRDKAAEEVHQGLSLLMERQKQAGFKFQKDPLLHIYVFDLGDSRNLFLWPTHHLLLDGWSSRLLLNETLQHYGILMANNSAELPRPPSHSEYLGILKKMDPSAARQFWSSSFKGMEFNTLINSGNNLQDDPIQISRKLTEAQTLDLEQCAGRLKVTLNTLFQGCWAIILGKLFKSREVTFGITVSGRAVDLPNMHLASGMYMNVHPIRVNFKETLPIAEWFLHIQRQLQQARNFEYLSLEDILMYLEQENIRLRFDTLFVFENYPNPKSVNGVPRISGYKSGLTSTYPLTITVLPGKQLEIVLLFNPKGVNKNEAHTILNSLVQLLELQSSNTIHSTGELDDLNLLIPSRERKIKMPRTSAQNHESLPPKNETELRLLKIWESIFDRNGLGIQDNFFELGGKSITAVRLITKLNSEFKTRFLPTILLQNPTIAELSTLLGRDQPEGRGELNNLVPIRASGSQSPLFCLHAGGGHVFFYSPLANQLNPNRPVYAIQPSGLYGNEQMHSTIGEMARDYVNQISSVVPEGPYNLLTFCFSTAVGLEMAYLLRAKGKRANVIIMDSLVEQQSLKTGRLIARVRGFAKRLLKNPFEAIKIMIGDRIELFLRPRWIQAFGTDEKRKISKVQLHLIKLYKQYSWPKNNAEISLLLTKKTDERFNKEAINSWEEITNLPVKVVHIQGSHRTIFEMPDVEHAARAVDKCCL